MKNKKKVNNKTTRENYEENEIRISFDTSNPDTVEKARKDLIYLIKEGFLEELKDQKKFHFTIIVSFYKWYISWMICLKLRLYYLRFIRFVSNKSKVVTLTKSLDVANRAEVCINHIYGDIFALLDHIEKNNKDIETV